MRIDAKFRGLVAIVLLVSSSASEGYGEFQITDDDEWQYNPAIYENIVVWTDYRNCPFSSNVDIYGCDLTTGEEFRITRNGNAQRSPAIYGDIVVWEDDRNDSRDEFYNLDIYGCNLLTGEEFQITEDPDVQRFPAVYGDTVVWTDERNGNYDIYGYNISTGEEFQITEDLYDQKGPAIYGDIVVWTDKRNSTMDIYRCNLSTGEEFQVFTGPGNQYDPAIYENIVVWTDNTDDFWDIYGYDLSKREGFYILTAPSERQAPAIYKDVIVWQDSRNFTRDIYGCTLQTVRMVIEADSLLDEGKAEYEKRDYVSALEYFEQAKEIYLTVGSKKAAECEEWIEEVWTVINADPDLLLKQGDAYLSKNMKDQAIDAYRKAADLYEETGDLSRSQEIRERILELEKLSETPPPPALPQWFAVLIVTAVLVGGFIALYLVQKRRQ